MICLLCFCLSGHAVSEIFLSLIQVYVGAWLRHYMPLKERIVSSDGDKLSQVSVSNASKRRLSGSGV